MLVVEIDSAQQQMDSIITLAVRGACLFAGDYALASNVRLRLLGLLLHVAGVACYGSLVACFYVRWLHARHRKDHPPAGQKLIPVLCEKTVFGRRKITFGISYITSDLALFLR